MCTLPVSCYLLFSGTKLTSSNWDKKSCLALDRALAPAQFMPQLSSIFSFSLLESGLPTAPFWASTATPAKQSSWMPWIDPAGNQFRFKAETWTLIGERKNEKKQSRRASKQASDRSSQSLFRLEWSVEKRPEIGFTVGLIACVFPLHVYIMWERSWTGKKAEIEMLLDRPNSRWPHFALVTSQQIQATQASLSFFLSKCFSTTSLADPQLVNAC